MAALLLLDPAIGLDGEWMREIAEAMFPPPTTRTPPRPATEKAAGSWADVDPAVLDAELDEHLVELPNGRYGWRISLPAMMSYWSELARDIVLPPGGNGDDAGAGEADVAAVCQRQLIARLRQRLGADFQLLDFDCNHMVPDAKPSRSRRADPQAVRKR